MKTFNSPVWVQCFLMGINIHFVGIFIWFYILDNKALTGRSVQFIRYQEWHESLKSYDQYTYMSDIIYSHPTIYFDIC